MIGMVDFTGGVEVKVGRVICGVKVNVGDGGISGVAVSVETTS